MAFNAYVQSQLDGLAARGCHTTELKVNLFKGYKAVKDDNFLTYLQIIQNADEDGTVPMNAQLLMLKAVNFYKNKLTRNKWELQSQNKKDILALRTEINTLKKSQGKGRKGESAKPSTDTKSKKSGNKGQRKAKTTEKPEKPKWLEQHTKPKSDAMNKSREWNSALWYWCGEETKGKCGGKWRTHKPKECKGLANKETKPKNKKEKDLKAGKRKADALRVATANEALLSDQDSSDYDS